MKTLSRDGQTLIRADATFCTIPFVSTPPWIDGKLDDPCWEQARTLDGFQDVTPYLQYIYDLTEENPLNVANPQEFAPEPRLEPARPRTQVRLCHDGRYLYAAFICQEPHPAELRKRDRPFSHLVNREDCVYLWLDPQQSHARPHSCEYIVNVAGQKSEFIWGRYSGDYSSLMAWEGRVTVHPNRWIAEIMIPLERLGINLKQSNVLGFNAGRGYRGDWQTHALRKPDGYYSPGWGFAILLGRNDDGLERGVATINHGLAEFERRKQGRALGSCPGSLIEPGQHRDSNPMVGISVWGPDHQPTISVGRSDSYDRRWYGNEDRAVTRKEVVAAAMSGDASRLDALRQRASRDQYGVHEHFPGPKPVGQIIFLLPGGTSRAWQTEVTRGADDAVELDCRSRKARVGLKIYVHKRCNLVVVEGTQEGLDGQELRIRLYRHRDNPPIRKLPGYDYDADEKSGRQIGVLPPPSVGRSGGMVWVKQPFFPDLTFPKGFEVVLAGQVSGAQTGGAEITENRAGLGTAAVSPYEGWIDPISNQAWGATEYRRLNATPGSAVTFRVKLTKPTFQALFPVVSTNDGANPLATARQLLGNTAALAPEALESESQGASPRERVGDYHYQQDLGLCSIFSAKFCLGDVTAWHADYHFNELLSARNYERFILGRTHELESYFQMLEANVPAARALAREAFGCRGIAWGVASFPARFKRLPMTSLDWDYSVECTGLVIQPAWLTYLYTMDRPFLAKRAYPLVKEAAMFYADYVTLEKDGRYHIWPCTSSEHVMLQPHLKYNRDAQGALAMARFILRAAIEGARTLGRDPGLVRRWRRVLDRLAPYPTEMTPEGPRFVDVAGARLMTEYNEFQPLSAVFFGDDIGLASPPAVIEIAKRTIEGLNRLSTPQHWHHVHRAMMRLGIYPGGAIFCENLIQSQQGPIFLFPAVPPNYTGQFEDYRTRGAFSVSAAMQNGAIRQVTVRSLAGGECRIDVSKFRRTPRVKRLIGGQGVACRLASGRYLCFATKRGQVYELVGM